MKQRYQKLCSAILIHVLHILDALQPCCYWLMAISACLLAAGLYNF